MRCDELRNMLTIYQRQEDQYLASQLIATHVRFCPSCARGLLDLAQAISIPDTFTCEQCRACFPSYYEATHPDHPQVSLPDLTIAAIALHLHHCLACREEFSALVELAEMEEMGL